MTPMFKVSAAAMAAVGAKTAEEFENKLVALLTSCGNLSASVETATKNLATLEKSNGELKAALDKANETISAQATQINGFKTTISGLETRLGDPKAITEENVKKWANEAGEIAGSKKAVEALGAVGGAPATAAPVNVPAAKAVAKSFTDLVAAECAAGKTKPDAVMAVIKTNPEAHAEWLKQGGKL